MSLRDEMQSNGLMPTDLILDNKFHRFKANKLDDKKSGWYVGHEVPMHSNPNVKLTIASYGNWKTGETFVYKNNVKMSKDDRKALDAELVKHKYEMELEKKREHDLAAIEAKALMEAWKKGIWLPPYNKRKGVKELFGALPAIDDDGIHVLVPMRNSAGEIRSVQKIYDDKKRFLYGSEKKGCFHVLREGEGNVYIAEGYATAATILEATENSTVVCAFDAGNLESVARVFRDRDSECAIVICADNDMSGVGQEKARSAKENVMGTLRICPEEGKDFNDIGVEATREYLYEEAPVAPPVNSVIIGGFTKKNSVDSLNAKIAATGKILFNEPMDNWYSYDTTWKKCSEAEIKTRLAQTIDIATQTDWQMRDFDSFFKAFKMRMSMGKEWNNDRNLLPFQNGVLDLTTREFRAHNYADYFNWHLPHEYNPAAKCPVFDRYLKELSDGDSGVEDILICYLAAIVRGRSDLQRYLELIGLTGTGKSTYIALAAELVGKNNHYATSMAQLADRFETANFFGKRLVTFADAKSYSNSADTFKALTGQDSLRYEEKNKQATAPFVFDGMVLISANEAIKFGDNSTAISRRRITVYVDKKLANVDETMKTQLSSELSGIINRVLEIPNEWISSVLKAATGEGSDHHTRALIETNSIAAWIDECCVLEAGVESKVGKKELKISGEIMDAHIHLYPSFLKWARETGRKEMSVQSFGTALTDVTKRWNIKKKKTMMGIYYQGIRVRRTNEIQSSPFYEYRMNTK